MTWTVQAYCVKGGEENERGAVEHPGRKTLKFWDPVVGITSPLYNEMPLVRFGEQMVNTGRKMIIFVFIGHSGT